MDRSADTLRPQITHASRVLAFARIAGDRGAITMAAAVLSDLVAQAGERGIDPGLLPAAHHAPDPAGDDLLAHATVWVAAGVRGD